MVFRKLVDHVLRAECFTSPLGPEQAEIVDVMEAQDSAKKGEANHFIDGGGDGGSELGGVGKEALVEPLVVV